MQWYYAVSGQRMGPVSEAEFAQLVQSGTIMPETLVWRQGFPKWEPHAAVAPLAAKVAVGATAGGGGADATAVGSEEMETCAVSGKRYPKREMIRYEGKWISGEHRDVFFQRMREGVTQPGHFTYGNFGRRFAAKFLDGIIQGIVSSLFKVLLSISLLGTTNIFFPNVRGISPQRFFLFQGLTFALSIVVALTYMIFFIRRYDATPGKMALGLKVLRADGTSLSVGRIVARYFSEWISAIILGIGYIMAGFDDQRRALHDRICDTRVIKVK